MAQKRFNPGTLNERIKFVHKSQGRDPLTGEPIITETTIRETWANVRESKSNWINSAQQIDITKTLVVTFRNRPDFVADNDMKVVWRGKEYVINSVPPNIDKRFDEVRISYES